MGLKPITISFKNNESDAKLHEWILEHDGHSGFIKNILKKHMLNKESVFIDNKSIDNSTYEVDEDNDDDDLLDI